MEIPFTCEVTDLEKWSTNFTRICPTQQDVEQVENELHVRFLFYNVAYFIFQICHFFLFF